MTKEQRGEVITQPKKRRGGNYVTRAGEHWGCIRESPAGTLVIKGPSHCQNRGTKQGENLPLISCCVLTGCRKPKSLRARDPE